jgi:23S rRNA pseudoU1915 N3-methylase RlmH
MIALFNLLPKEIKREKLEKVLWPFHLMRLFLLEQIERN